MSVTLISVEVRNGDINKALKIFKRRVEKSNHINELRDRQYYLKPSIVKRIAKNKIEHSIELQKNPKNIKIKKK